VRELGASIFLVGPGTHVLGTISLTMWEEGSSYGAVAALGVIQIVPLAIIVAGLRAVELRSNGAHKRSRRDPAGGPWSTPLSLINAEVGARPRSASQNYAAPRIAPGGGLV